MGGKSKGKRNERNGRDILENAGWLVEIAVETQYPQKYGVDFFGKFDLIAIREGEKPLFIQVKTNGARGIETFHEECKEIGIPFEQVDVEFWVRYDREGWRILSITPDGYEEKIDERDSDRKIGEVIEEEYS